MSKTREEQIQAIGKAIQKQIDKLKEFNCSIDSSYEVIGIFDNTIEPRHKDMFDGDDCSNQIVFSFNLSVKSKKNNEQ